MGPGEAGYVREQAEGAVRGVSDSVLTPLPDERGQTGLFLRVPSVQNPRAEGGAGDDGALVELCDGVPAAKGARNAGRALGDTGGGAVYPARLLIFFFFLVSSLFFLFVVSGSIEKAMGVFKDEREM